MYTLGAIRQPAFGTQSLPGGLGAGDPTGGLGFGVGSAQQLFAQTVSAMQMVVTALMTQMTVRQVAMPGNSFFGGTGGSASQGSPLSDFLGSVGGSLGPNSLLNQNSGSKGERIPGGKSLYSKGRGMFHKGAPGAPDTYAFENSPAGIAFAAKHGYASIDIDMQITKDGVPVATHWSQPLKKDGFYDPLGKLDKNTKVSDMTLAEVMRLRNKDGQSQIYPMSTMIEQLKKHGIAGDLEAKDDKRFATDKVMGYLADLVRDAGIKANLKSIDRGSRSDKILEKAQEHGFWVRTAKAGKSRRKDIGYGS